MSKHVVLVEDELNIAEAIRFVLSNDGWRVETLANGLNAVEVIRKARPDLVLLDVMLPGRSGFEILHDLRADPAFADLQLFRHFGQVYAYTAATWIAERNWAFIIRSRSANHVFQFCFISRCHNHEVW